MRVPENKKDDEEEEKLGARIDSNLVLKTSTTSPHVFKTPKLEEFENTCMPISLILGYFNAMSQRYLYTKKRTLKHAHNVYQDLKLLRRYPKSLKGLWRLRKIYLSLISDLDLAPSGPFQLSVIKNICDYFNMNCTVWSNAGHHIMFKYPEISDLRLSHVYLLYTRSNAEDNVGHVDLLINEEKYMQVKVQYGIVNLKTKINVCLFK